MCIRSIIVALIVVPLSLPAASQGLVQNGSFEANGGSGSNVLPEWSIVDEAGGSGTWVAQTGAIGPVTSTCGPHDVEPPPAGSFAAMSTQAAPGSHVLYQDVAIPGGANPVLSFHYYIRSVAGLFSPDSLSFHTNPNQQFRVDVVEPGSNPFTLDVLQTVLVVGGGNPRQSGYQRHTTTLAGFGGRTIRLRFVEVDNQGCFYAGVDDVRLEIDPATPPPGIVRFTAEPLTVPFAGASTLTWATQHASSVEIDHGIGAVPPNGSRSVSLQEETTYVLTATGPGGTARREVSISVRAPGPSVHLSASPDFVEKGQPATLTWTTSEADEAAIDNAIGAVPLSGSLTVTPSATTEYTLTATGSGVTSRARATVFVDPGDVPIVTVTSHPRGIVDVAGAPAGAVDRLALTNLGRVPTTITLGRSGDFFTHAPESFTLEAGATQVVTITTTVQAAGKYEGSALPAGPGVPEGLSIPVRLFLADAPTGTVAPTTAVARTEIAAPANENPSGSVTFANGGTGTLQGIVTSDVAWLIPQSDVVVIEPGVSKEVKFTTNRALRHDAASPGGAATATLTLSYLDFPGSSLRSPESHDGGSSQGSISVTVVDVVKASAVPSTPQPLGAGEVAFFVPGLAQVPGSSGDLLLSIVGSSVSDLKLFLGAPGRPSILGSLDQIAPNAGVTLPSILHSLFASSAPVGTVQARSVSLLRVALAALQTNTARLAGSYITALPTFRSDRSAAPGQAIHLPGVEKSAGRSTNVYVQEVSGLPARAKIDYLNAAGEVVSSREEAIGAFALLSLADSVPATAASVRITNTSGNAARITGYAAVVDASTQDAWTIVDSQSLAGPSSEQIVAVLPPAPLSATSGNALYVLNPGENAVEVVLEDRFTPARRRAVRMEAASSAEPVTVGPGETVRLPIEFSSGFVRVTASGPLVVSARSTQSAAGRAGTFGSALPVLPLSAALMAGQSRRFGGVDDAGRATVAAGTPVTYRSSVGLIESSGTPAVVRVTLRYSFGAGSRSSAQGVSSVNVRVPANRLLLLKEIARAVIGPSRDGYGDLRNLQIDVEVLSGGRVLPFVQTFDNGSGDSAIRVQ